MNISPLRFLRGTNRVQKQKAFVHVQLESAAGYPWKEKKKNLNCAFEGNCIDRPILQKDAT